jgi:tRNA threonylcarbamoyladenosine biosynthesis protein TsaE
MQGMASILHQIEINSPDQTANLAISLGQILKAGDCLLLVGSVGAGKSLFARALIQSLQDTPEDVPSPTFTIIQTYETKLGDLWHCDLYRISSPHEVIELGLDDAMATAVTLIEWPENLADLTPPDALTIRINDLGGDVRKLSFESTDSAWAAPLEKAFENAI